jgi:putative transposase
MHQVATMCRVLGVSPGGYYAQLKRPLSARATADVELSARIAEIHRRSRQTYGAPRIHAELEKQGIRVGCKRVARLMRAAGLHGVSRRNWIITTVRDRHARPAPDLVERNFAAAAPNRLWVADITYIPTWAGFLYLAVVLEVFSRRIVGWAMETFLRTELVLKALDMALGQRRAAGVIHHSEANTPRSLSANAARRPRCAPRWARWATVSTMPCARVSSPHSNANWSTGAVLRPRSRRAWPCSISSRPGTILTAAIRPSTISRRSTTKGAIQHRLISAAQHCQLKRVRSTLAATPFRENALPKVGLKPLGRGPWRVARTACRKPSGPAIMTKHGGTDLCAYRSSFLQ